MSGGYDDGYVAAPCFWGTSPGRLILELERRIGGFRDLHVLDAGCGEGKNAAYMSSLGATVNAIDVSNFALANGRKAWPSEVGVEWMEGDVRTLPLARAEFDIVIAYGLLHCFSSADEIAAFVKKVKWATKSNGYHVACTFNSRRQELHAHPGFNPVLMPHSFYCDLYADWDVLSVTDEDLHEVHPHNGVPHTHSMTRLIARAPNG